MDTVEKIIFEYHLALSQKENQKRIKQYQKEDPLMMAYFVLCTALYMYLLKWSPFSTKVNFILIAVIVISLFAFLFFFLGRIGTRKWKAKVALTCMQFSVSKKKCFSPSSNRRTSLPNYFITNCKEKNSGALPSKMSWLLLYQYCLWQHLS